MDFLLLNEHWARENLNLKCNPSLGACFLWVNIRASSSPPGVRLGLVLDMHLGTCYWQQPSFRNQEEEDGNGKGRMNIEQERIQIWSATHPLEPASSKWIFEHHHHLGSEVIDHHDCSSTYRKRDFVSGGRSPESSPFIKGSSPAPSPCQPPVILWQISLLMSFRFVKLGNILPLGYLSRLKVKCVEMLMYIKRPQGGKWKIVTMARVWKSKSNKWLKHRMRLENL